MNNFQDLITSTINQVSKTNSIDSVDKFCKFIEEILIYYFGMTIGNAMTNNVKEHTTVYEIVCGKEYIARINVNAKNIENAENKIKAEKSKQDEKRLFECGSYQLKNPINSKKTRIICQIDMTRFDSIRLDCEWDNDTIIVNGIGQAPIAPSYDFKTDFYQGAHIEHEWDFDENIHDSWLNESGKVTLCHACASVSQ